MSEEHESSRAPSTPPELQSELDRGLAFAFGRGQEPSGSVLRILQARTESRLGVHLPDSEGPAGAPVKIGDEAKALRDTSGRYQVLGEIARGGMGVVYKGRDTDLGRDVAMKVLHEKYDSNAEVLERFVEEAQIGGQLQHPGIVPVYELGLQHGERPYFAMKLVKGETLAARLARRADTAEDRRRYFGVFEQVCQTMAYAHARRVVHRDLKPANVMIGMFGEVQVVDWGFAKVLDGGGVVDEVAAVKSRSERSVIETVRSSSGSSTHSVMGSMLGTPAYMSPEQAIGDVDRMDQRSDVFGLGGILCEILTGAPPYVEEDGDLVQQAARGDTGKAVARLDACGANEVMIALCKQCLAPARRARPQTAKEVADRVGAYLTSVEERAREAEIRAAQAKLRARSTVMLSVAAVLVLAMGAGGYLWVQKESAKRRADAEQPLTAAMQDVSARLGEARAGAADDLGPWAEVETAAREVERLAASEFVGGALAQRVHDLLHTARHEHDDAVARVDAIERDRAMRELLLSVRIPADDDILGKDWHATDARRTDRAYGEAFAGYLDGQKVQDLSIGDAADALSTSPIAVELAAALDHWALVRRGLGHTGDLTKKLERLARRLDSDDAWRNDLRDLIPHAENKRAELEALAQTAVFADLPKLSIVLLGEALWSVDARKAALEVYRRGRLVHPDDFGLCFRLALMRELGGRWSAEVVGEYSTAAAIRPEMNEAWHRLGNALGCVGRHREAEEVFRMLVAREPDSKHWQQHVGDCLKNQGKSAEAIAIYEQILAKHPESPWVHNSLGVALWRQGKLDEALASYRRATAIMPSLALVHANIGVVLSAQGDSEAAIESFHRALQHAPKQWKARQALRAELVALGRRDEAIASHLDWLELEPERPQIYFDLGNMLRLSGDPEEAISHYRRASALFAKSSEGGAQQSMQMADAWITTLQKALEQRPRLLAIARGEVESTSARALVDAADAAYQAREYVASARTYERAFAASTGSIRNSYTHRYNSVCSKILAAGRHGVDASGLNDEERQELRDSAYDYLAWRLAREVRYIDQRSQYVASGRERLSWWQNDKDLAGVRDEEPSKVLPPEEAARWRQLWRDVQTALARTDPNRLRAIAHGEAEAASAEDWLTAAYAAYQRKEHAAAARTYAAALTAHPEMLPEWPHRYNLACSLALAASGQGVDAKDLDDVGRARSRAEAREWLAAELALVQQRLERGEEFYEMVRRLKHWQRDVDFAGVRGDGLESLPAEEVEPWRELWGEVGATLHRAEQKK